MGVCGGALSSRSPPARPGRGLRSRRGCARARGPSRTTPALPAQHPHRYPQDTRDPLPPRHSALLHTHLALPTLPHPALLSRASPPTPQSRTHPSLHPALPHYRRASCPSSTPRSPYTRTRAQGQRLRPRVPGRVLRARPRVRGCPRAGTGAAAGGAPLPSRPRTDPGPLSRGRRPGAEPSAMGAELEAGGAAAAAGDRRRRRSARGGGRGAP